MRTYKYQVFWTKKWTFDTEKTQENKGEEDWAFIGAVGFTKIINFQSSSLFFISSSLLLIWFYVYYEL